MVVGDGGVLGEKHEIYAVAFGSHPFYDLFYRAGGGGMAPRSPPLEPLLVTQMVMAICNNLKLYLSCVCRMRWGLERP